MADQEKLHLEKVEELKVQVEERDGQNSRLNTDLTNEKQLKQSLEQERANLLKQYEEDKAFWADQKQKMEQNLQRQVSLLKARVPFDPFG